MLELDQLVGGAGSLKDEVGVGRRNEIPVEIYNTQLGEGGGKRIDGMTVCSVEMKVAKGGWEHEGMGETAS